MIITVNIDKNADPNLVGEYLLKQINQNERWGFCTREAKGGAKLVEITKCPELEPKYEHVYENIEECYFSDPQYYFLQIPSGEEFYVGLHWDGDGYVTIHSIREGWTVSNTDCKDSTYWKWENDN